MQALERDLMHHYKHCWIYTLYNFNGQHMWWFSQLTTLKSLVVWGLFCYQHIAVVFGEGLSTTKSTVLPG